MPTFDEDCTSQDEDFIVPEGSSTYSKTRSILGCAVGPVTITATLLAGTTAVASATHDIDVVSGPSVRFYNLPEAASVDEDITFTVNAANLDSAVNYTLRISTDGSNLGVLFGCGTTQDEISISGSTNSTQSEYLVTCAAPGGTVTATLLTGGTELHSVSQSVRVS